MVFLFYCKKLLSKYLTFVKNGVIIKKNGARNMRVEKPNDRKIGAIFLRVVQARQITFQTLANKLGYNSRQAIAYRLNEMKDKSWHRDDLEEWITKLNIQGKTKDELIEIYETERGYR